MQCGFVSCSPTTPTALVREAMFVTSLKIPAVSRMTDGQIFLSVQRGSFLGAREEQPNSSRSLTANEVSVMMCRSKTGPSGQERWEPRLPRQNLVNELERTGLQQSPPHTPSLFVP